MDPLGLKKALSRRMQIAAAMEGQNQPPVPPPGQGMPGQMPPQGGPPGMPPGVPPPPGQMPPQMSQAQFARPFSPEERMRQAMLKSQALRRFRPDY
jgi:hypothetical protein